MRYFALSLCLLSVLAIPGSDRPVAVPTDPELAGTRGPGAGATRKTNVPPERRHAAFQTLLAYSGKDLEKLPESQTKELRNTLASLLPGREVERFCGYRPHHFWQFRNQPPLHLLFEVYAPTIHPGTTGMRLTLFD